MRSLNVTAYGGPEVLEIAEVPEPTATDGQVRVRMQAAAVNPVDQLTRQGFMAGLTPGIEFPFTLGFDVAGILLDDAGSLAAGQRVVGLLPWLARPGLGSNAEVVSVDPAWLAPLPDEIDWAVAGTLPVNALAAHQALELAGPASWSDQTVLVTGAGGAVGAFAVQLAVARGARVLATASAYDEEFVAGLGAEVITRGPAEEMVDRVTSLVPGGVDVLFDTAGIGAAILPATRDAGVFVAPSPPLAPASERGVRVEAVDSKPDADVLGSIAKEVASGALVSRVADFVPLAQARSAHHRAAAGGLRGKIVLDFS